MHMLTRRLQILLDEDRYARVSAEAERRGQPVAVIVREAIDAALPSDQERRRAALLAFLDAEPMEVPEDPADLKAELDAIRGEKFG